MKKFKLDLSKDQKKYNLVFYAESEKEARERVHKEGYSILNVIEISEWQILWNKFVFSWIKDWKKSTWKVLWDDIFKAYLKLVESFWYKIIYIYPEIEKNINDIEKNKILKQLEEQYGIYKKNKTKEKEKQKIEKKENGNELEHFYLKKELEEVYKLIRFVLEKIQNVIDWKEVLWVSIEQKEKLKLIYNDIVKLKKSTNLSKLRQIWEKALLKIWEHL